MHNVSNRQGLGRVDILLVTGLVALLVWFWTDSIRARERALKRLRGLCDELNAQLLDQTVSLKRIRPARQAGRLGLRRWYDFEVSYAGTERCAGFVIILGTCLEYIFLNHPAGPIVINAQHADEGCS